MGASLDSGSKDRQDLGIWSSQILQSNKDSSKKQDINLVTNKCTEKLSCQQEKKNIHSKQINGELWTSGQKKECHMHHRMYRIKSSIYFSFKVCKAQKLKIKLNLANTCIKNTSIHNWLKGYGYYDPSGHKQFKREITLLHGISSIYMHQIYLSLINN